MPSQFDAPAEEARYSIAVVANKTGLTQLVLRAWERRYAAVVPARTETGRRLYTESDVLRLTLLKNLTGAGHRIGDVATLTVADLQALADQLPGAEAEPATLGRHGSTPRELLDQAMAAIGDMNPEGLRGVLDAASLQLSKPLLRNELIVPLMAEIGHGWGEGELRVAHEHMASAEVITFLSAMNARHVAPPGAPVLVAGTPTKHTHEIGALIGISQAQDSGWNVLNLGVDLPAEDIAMAVKYRHARALFLSLIYPRGDEVVADQIATVRRLVGPELPIVISGAASESYSEVLGSIGAHVATDAEAFGAILSKLRPS